MYKTLWSKLKLSKDQNQFLKILTRASKDLYNQALYNVRQHYLKTGEYLDYYNNQKLLSRDSDNYRILNTSQSQTIIRKVDEAMKSFFGALKRKENKVKLPGYLDKNGTTHLLTEWYINRIKNTIHYREVIL